MAHLCLILQGLEALQPRLQLRLGRMGATAAFLAIPQDLPVQSVAGTSTLTSICIVMQFHKYLPQLTLSKQGSSSRQRPTSV